MKKGVYNNDDKYYIICADTDDNTFHYDPNGAADIGKDTYCPSTVEIVDMCLYASRKKALKYAYLQQAIDDLKDMRDKAPQYMWYICLVVDRNITIVQLNGL